MNKQEVSARKKKRPFSGDTPVDTVAQQKNIFTLTRIL